MTDKDLILGVIALCLVVAIWLEFLTAQKMLAAMETAERELQGAADELMAQSTRLETTVETLRRERAEAMARERDMIADLRAALDGKPAAKTLMTEADARDLFLRRGPDYEQVGDLSFLKPEHMKRLQEMGATMERRTFSAGHCWYVLNSNGIVAVHEDPLEALRMAEAKFHNVPY